MQCWLICLAKEDWPSWSKSRPENWSSLNNNARSRRNKDWGWERSSNSDSSDWGRAVSWGRGIGWGRGIDGLTAVLDISNVAIAISGVGDSLGAAIRKGNVVLSIGVVTFTGLTSSKVGSTGSISNSVVVVVRGDGVRVDGLSNDWAIGWGKSCILRSSGGGSHKSKQSNKALQVKKKTISNLGCNNY